MKEVSLLLDSGAEISVLHPRDYYTVKSITRMVPSSVRLHISMELLSNLLLVKWTACFQWTNQSQFKLPSKLSTMELGGPALGGPEMKALGLILNMGTRQVTSNDPQTGNIASI